MAVSNASVAPGLTSTVEAAGIVASAVVPVKWRTTYPQDVPLYQVLLVHVRSVTLTSETVCQVSPSMLDSSLKPVRRRPHASSSPPDITS